MNLLASRGSAAADERAEAVGLREFRGVFARRAHYSVWQQRQVLSLHPSHNCNENDFVASPVFLKGARSFLARSVNVQLRKIRTPPCIR